MNAIKEQQAQIEEQKAQNQILLDRLEKQEKEMEMLKALVCTGQASTLCVKPSQAVIPK